MTHVGDSYRFDYVIPKKHGIHAFYLDRQQKKKGEFVVKSLKAFEKKFINSRNLEQIMR